MFRIQRQAAQPRISMLGMIFLLLIAGSSITQVCANANLLNAEEPTDPTQLIKNQIKDICTSTPLRHPNKVSDVRFDFLLGGTVPISCMEDLSSSMPVQSAQCKLEREKQKTWREGKGLELGKALSIASNNHVKGSALSDELARDIDNVFDLLTEKQQSKFVQALQKIARLRNAHSMAKYAAKLKIGNCGEQASHDVIKLLKLNSNFKIQVIEGRHKSNTNHYFIVIDSNIPDINIKNDYNKVAAYLEDLDQGFICDNWNKNYFEDVRKNNIEGYFNDWSSIKVESFSLNFDFKGLPDFAIKVVTDELARMGLKANMDKPAIKFFDKPVAKIKAEDLTKTSSHRMEL